MAILLLESIASQLISETVGLEYGKPSAPVQGPATTGDFKMGTAEEHVWHSRHRALLPVCKLWILV